MYFSTILYTYTKTAVRIMEIYSPNAAGARTKKRRDETIRIAITYEHAKRKDGRLNNPFS